MSTFPLPKIFAGYEHIRRYWDSRQQLCIAKILPGEYYVTGQDELLVTVVGSCVTACIRDSVTGVGGMNHFMLPSGGEQSANQWQSTPVNSAARYGSYAMEHLINEVLRHGGRRQSLEVKLFGGGKILGTMANIGQQNIDFAKAYVETERLHLLAEDLGDVYPRKVIFHPRTGRVRLKKLRATANVLLQQESTYRQNLENQSLGGDVDWF